MNHVTVVGVMWTVVNEPYDNCGGYVDYGERVT